MEQRSTVQKQVLMAVLAHPDDESFGMGGTLALYGHRGAEVHLICATRGEVGEVSEEDMKGFTTIEELREHELRCAALKLDLCTVDFLGYRDSGMPGMPANAHPNALAAAPLEEVAAKVVYWIRKFCPQVVLTFDPIGGYRHPDHIAIHNATVRAFRYAGDPEWKSPIALPEDLPPFQPSKLYFHVIPRGFLRLAVKFMPLFGRDPRKFGRNGDIDIASLANVYFPVHARIDYGEVAEAKTEASLCHKSQGGAGMTRGLMGWVMRRGGFKESFMQAYPPPVNKKITRDLFAGL
jgi:LmbE family N-acetylglucosaminyl deacetylase